MMSFSGARKLLFFLVAKKTAVSSPLLVLILANAPVQNAGILRQEEQNTTEINKLPEEFLGEFFI